MTAAANKTATLLLAVLCVGLARAAAADADTNSTAEYSCDALAKVPAEQQCSFIRDSCESESLVPYAEWYYCHAAHWNVFMRGLYLAAVCCLLPLAFCLLGDTAEFYIAPIMAHVSQAVPKMRPRFAGVTFVALGNGAPDLSANIAAISAGEITLSAGALTGAAMFVQCIVAAELVALAGPGGIKCGGAMLRDVGVYCLAILSVLLAFYIGRPCFTHNVDISSQAFPRLQVSQFFVGWAVTLYIVYMIWVFAGDEWHQRGRPRLRVQRSIKQILGNYLPNADATQPARQSWAGIEGSGGGGAGPGLRTASASEQQRFSSVQGVSTRDELEESLLPWAVADEEPDQFYTPVEYAGGSGMQAGLLHNFSSAPDRYAALRASSGAGSMGRFVPPAGARPSSLLSMQYSTELSDFGTVQFSQRGSIMGEDAGSLQGLSPRQLSGSANAAAAAVRQYASADGAVQSDDIDTSPHLRVLSQPAAGPPAGFSGPRGLTAQQSSSYPQHLHVQQQQQHMQQPHLVNMGSHSYLDPKTYKQLVWADLADDQEEEERLEREIAQQLWAGRQRGGSFAGPAAGFYRPPVAMLQPFSSLPTTPQRQAQQPAAPWPGASIPQAQAAPVAQQTAAAAAAAGAAPAMESGLLLSPFGPQASRTAPSSPLSVSGNEAAAAAAAVGGGVAVQQGYDSHWQQASEQQQQQAVVQQPGVGSWQQLQWELTLGNSAEWEEAGAVRKLFRQVTFPLLLPAYLGQRFTIPFASSAGYSREWLIAALLCCPLALILYLGQLTITAVLVACCCGIAAAVAAGVLTHWDEPGQMPVQGLGGLAAVVVPGVLAVLAFCMGVVWIDTIATEVVGVITFLGGLASLPAGVMGLTLLAWGNSLGDFFGNRAMARAGHGSTAITACFAAPLFNMLMSLSLGFSSYLHKLGAGVVHVTLTPEVALGCLFLMGYNVVIIAVGHFCGNRLPPWFAYFARGWYALYFGLSVFSGFYGSSSSATSAQS